MYNKNNIKDAIYEEYGLWRSKKALYSVSPIKSHIVYPEYAVKPKLYE